MWLLEKRAAEGKSSPALDNRPSLYADLEEVWQAFSELNRTRQSGFGPAAITIESIVQWLDLHGIDDQSSRLEYYELIIAMDCEYLKWAKEQSEKDRPRKATK